MNDNGKKRGEALGDTNLGNGNSFVDTETGLEEEVGTTIAENFLPML